MQSGKTKQNNNNKTFVYTFESIEVNAFYQSQMSEMYNYNHTQS